MSRFEATVTADERVLIRRAGRTVGTVAGESGRRLADRLRRATSDERRQGLLARATGDYRRGNER